MLKIIPGIVIALMNMILAAGVTVADDERVWVTDDEEQIVISTVGVTSLAADMEDAFDVSDLADGETRTFGEGDRQVKVTRDGDTVTIQHPARGNGVRSILCSLLDDVCKILHVDGEPGQTMVMIRKHRTCEGDDENCAQLTADVMVEEGSPHVLVRKVVRCDGDGNCEESETESHSALAEAFVTVAAGDAESMKQMIFVGDGGEGPALMVRAEGKVALQCPEGDTTMLVDEENADRVYYCPEHNVPLERKAARSGVRTIRIETREEGDED